MSKKKRARRERARIGPIIRRIDQALDALNAFDNDRLDADLEPDEEERGNKTIEQIIAALTYSRELVDTLDD